MTTFTGRPDAAPVTSGAGLVMRAAFTDAELAQTGLGKYVAWLSDRGRRFDNYLDMWQWSVDELEDFWATLWEYFAVAGSSGSRVLSDPEMPGASWFPTARLNYAENVLRSGADPQRTAILGRSQTRGPVELTFGDLAEQVRRARLAFQSLGVRKGDRVAG